MEMGYLLDEHAAAYLKRLKEAEEIRASAPDEAEEVLARERTTSREILAGHTPRPRRSPPQCTTGFPSPLGLPT
jgi:hypothetical protein